MKDTDLLPSGPIAGAGAALAAVDVAGLFGKGRYKFWALAAILLLAFWSMFTGSVTLKWSAGNLARASDDIDAPIHGDLDVLEMEEREKVVRHMWDVYTHTQLIQLPRFWQEAFEAAYEQLASEDPAVRDPAVTEIAKMSMRIADLETPSDQRSKMDAPKSSLPITRTRAKSSAENQ